MNAIARCERAREPVDVAAGTRPCERHPNIDSACGVAFVEEIQVVTEATSRGRNHDGRITRGKGKTEPLSGLPDPKEDRGVTWIAIGELRRSDDQVTHAVSIKVTCRDGHTKLIAGRSRDDEISFGARNCSSERTKECIGASGSASATVVVPSADDHVVETILVKVASA